MTSKRLPSLLFLLLAALTIAALIGGCGAPAAEPPAAEPAEPAAPAAEPSGGGDGCAATS